MATVLVYVTEGSRSDRFVHSDRKALFRRGATHSPATPSPPYTGSPTHLPHDPTSETETESKR